jgi:hypothetical protein
MPPLNDNLLSPTGARIQPRPARPDPHVVSPEVAEFYIPGMVKLGALMVTAADISASIVADERELAALRRDVTNRIILQVKP